ncbi:MAG: hypothetical protein KC592_05535 [Nitrospira sp.]|nr:hypothetical protein [Nitrospira sp.]
MSSNEQVLAELEKTIDQFCGKKLESERHKLFLIFRTLDDIDPSVSKKILIIIRNIHINAQNNRIMVQDRDWYWKERTKLESQIQELSEHPLIRTGIHLDKIQFYGPEDVDCVHGRKRKICETIGNKIAYLNMWKQWLEGPPIKQGPAWERQLEIPRKWMAHLLDEIKNLDGSVNANNVETVQFCAPMKEEHKIFSPNPIRNQRGAPSKWLHDHLLMTVGILIMETSARYREPLTYQEISKIIAAIITRCFPDKYQSEVDLLSKEKKLSEALNRQWRHLRKPHNSS